MGRMGRSSSPARRWVVLVARDESDLYEHLRRAFASDRKVQVVIDRRRDRSRNPTWVNDQLDVEGAVVIRIVEPEDGIASN
jgi:hypothetical protein